MQRLGMSDVQVHDEIWTRRQRGETYAALGPTTAGRFALNHATTAGSRS